MMQLNDKSELDKIVYMDARDMNKLRARMSSEVKFPATLLQIGLKMNGFPFAIFYLGTPTVSDTVPSGGVDPTKPVITVDPTKVEARKGGRKKASADDDDSRSVSHDYEGDAQTL